MNEVITRAKAAVLGLRAPTPPRMPEQPLLKQDQSYDQPPIWQEATQPQYASPTISDPLSKPSSFAPDPSEFNKPLYMRGIPQHNQQPQHHHQAQPMPTPNLQYQQQNLEQQRNLPPAHYIAEHQNNGEYRSSQKSYPPPNSNYQPQHHAPPSARPMPPREENVYEKKLPPVEPKRYAPEVPYRPPHNQVEQRPAESAPKFFSAPPRNPNRPAPPGMAMPPRGLPIPPSKDEQRTSGPMNGHPPQPPRLPYGASPSQQRPPSGAPSSHATESTSDSSGYQRDRYNGPVALQPDDQRKFPGIPRSYPSDSRSDVGSSLQSRHGEADMSSWRTQDSAPSYERNESQWQSNAQTRPSPTGPPTRKPLLGHMPSFNNDGPSRPTVPTTGPPSSRSKAPSSLPHGSSSQPLERSPLMGSNFGTGSSVPRTPPRSPKYVELSRLPTEMLRPAVLEQFLRPSVPLQVSSVKVVYSSQGIHMNTLVRFDNPSDADHVLDRDGELGIRVRPCSKRSFDDAVDGLPPAVLNAAPEGASASTDHKRDSDHTRRRSRSRSRDRRRGKRDPSPRKRQRSRSRSRERRTSRRSRSRSPKRPRQPPTSTRWCLQLTNVPFRCTEADLIGWLSERVRPTKVTRTYYAEGNATDRWIAEFESESLMQRALGIKRPLSGRTIKMCPIDNNDADELMKIEDVYGERKKEVSEAVPIRVAEKVPPNPRVIGDPAPVFFSAPPRGMSAFGPGGHPWSAGAGPAVRGRGKGRGIGPPPPFPRDIAPRGRGRGLIAGRGGKRDFADPPNLRSARKSPENDENMKIEPPAPGSPEPEPVTATDDFVASLGPRGTVISCVGFPSDVTMEDVLGFFHGYPVDHNSVRIRMGDDGVPTGECMLAMKNSESSSKAVSTQSGKKVRGKVVTLQLANP